MMTRSICAGNKTWPLIRVPQTPNCPLGAGRVAVRSTAPSLTATEGFAGPIVYSVSCIPVQRTRSRVAEGFILENRWIIVDSHHISWVENHLTVFRILSSPTMYSLRLATPQADS